MAELVEVVEGKARVLVPAAERAERGPGDKDDAPVFFNPAMATNRDLASLLLQVKAAPDWVALDGLAASGLRGIRYALEAGITAEWNDWNPVAVKQIEENAKRNGLEPRVTRRNLNALLHEGVWHVVELDPYGSPAPFLDAATRAVRDGGLLGVTATDTTGLAGVYPKVCERRYDARPMHGELGHEVALRILAGAVVRQGAKHEIAYAPLLAHATDHYYRLMFQARRGAQRADAALERIGNVRLCGACGHRGFAARGDGRACPECGGACEVAGPLWTGPLEDGPTVDAMQARTFEVEVPFGRWRESRFLLNLLVSEAKAPPLFYDLHAFGARLKLGSPSTARVVAGLREAGFEAWSVHFNGLGIRTDAPAKEMARFVREASSR